MVMLTKRGVISACWKRTAVAGILKLGQVIRYEQLGHSCHQLAQSAAPHPPWSSPGTKSNFLTRQILETRQTGFYKGYQMIEIK